MFPFDFVSKQWNCKKKKETAKIYWVLWRNGIRIKEIYTNKKIWQMKANGQFQEHTFEICVIYLNVKYHSWGRYPHKHGIAKKTTWSAINGGNVLLLDLPPDPVIACAMFPL